jgi:hypothetical protein
MYVDALGEKKEKNADCFAIEECGIDCGGRQFAVYLVMKIM